MDIRKEILDSPRAVRETLEKGRREYEALVRGTRWGEEPIYIIGCGTSFLAAFTAVYAFEGLLGRPAVARSAVDFERYALPVVRPRSIVLAISRSGESRETLDAARAARARGAVLLALTNNPASALAGMADGVFQLRAGEERGPATKTVLCLQAALGYLGLIAARTLKRHHPQLDILEEEFAKLPRHLEWVLTQVSDAVRSISSELKSPRSLCLVGGGFYFPSALLGATHLKELAGIHAEGFEPNEFLHGPLEMLERDNAVVILSGSGCRVKKNLHEVVRRLTAWVNEAGGKIYSVTDGNDRELSGRSTLAVLLPVLAEMVGSTVALAFLQLLAYQVAREKGRDPNRWRVGSEIRREER